jgi:hypothetical protein
MFKVPMQNLFGAGLLLTLAFTVNDSSSASGPSAAEPKVRFACGDGAFSRTLDMTANSERRAGRCREVNFR